MSLIFIRISKSSVLEGPIHEMLTSQIAKFMGPTWGPPGSCRPQMGPMLAPWILLSGIGQVIPRGWTDANSNDDLLPEPMMGRSKDGYRRNQEVHYNDVIMGAMASQITSLTIVYSIIYSCADQRKHQSFASLALVRGIHRWPVNSPHQGPVTWKMLPFDDFIMRFSLYIYGVSPVQEFTLWG